MQLLFTEPTPVAPLIVPRWYQAEAVEACWQALRTESPCIVIPTGGGKSLVIAMLCQRARQFGGRIMVLQPSQELIQQNADECLKLMPGVDVGIYSAGLRRRHTDHDIVFAGIQSCYAKAHEFGRRDLVLIDEAHLIPPDGEGRYRTFLKDLRELCPHFRLAGLTATPFRTGTGDLCGPTNLLTKVCYSASVARLMTEPDPITGTPYLCPVTSKPMTSEVDTSGLKIARTGDFDERQMESLFDTNDNVNAAVDELAEKAVGRKSVLVFTSGVKHAAHVADRLASTTGERVGLITGDTLPIERAATISDFKSQVLRWLVNVNVLTTGFNARGVDAIAVLRATDSPGLFAQICGRGFRTHHTKTDCLILDFGENIKRHGALDSPEYGLIQKRKRKEQEAEAAKGPQKECPGCNAICAASVRACPECGFVWPDKERHGKQADTESRILDTQAEPTEWIVESVSFHRHAKRNDPDAPNTLRVDYVCQPAEGGGNLTKKTISEWVCLDHEGFAKRKAMQWWRERSLAELTADDYGSVIDDAIRLFSKCGAVAVANRIWTLPQGKFVRIVRQELDEIPQPDQWHDGGNEYSEPAWEPVYFNGQPVGEEVPF